jgi:hypothetical protein
MAARAASLAWASAGRGPTPAATLAASPCSSRRRLRRAIAYEYLTVQP